jgi:hypothetical protein
VDEDDIGVRRPASGADQRDQPGKTLAGVDRIERQRLQPTGQPDRLDGRVVRDAVGRAGMAGDDLDASGIEAQVEQVGRPPA